MSALFIVLTLVALALLIIGLVVPQVFAKSFRGKPSRGKIAGLFGGLTILMFICFGVTSGGSNQPNTTSTSTPNPSPNVTLDVDSPSEHTQKIVNATESFFSKKNDNGTVTNIEVADYDGGGYGVYVQYTGVASVRVAESVMANGYLAIHKSGEDIRAVSIYSYFDAQDKYGNASVQPYYKTLIEATDWAKINWNEDDGNLTTNVIPGVWSVTQNYSQNVH
jgi:hypothetical protein